MNDVLAGRGRCVWQPGDLEGLRIATSYPNLVGRDLARRGLDAEVIRLDGAVRLEPR